jgi:hypothetical protein
MHGLTIPGIGSEKLFPKRGDRSTASILLLIASEAYYTTLWWELQLSIETL